MTDMKRSLYFCLPVLFFFLYSCEDILLEDDISDEVVELTAPVDGAQFNSTGITFTWEPIKNGTQYRIQIAKPDFDNPMQIIADETVEITSFTTQLNIGQYEWRVQAVNSGYETDFTTRSITIVSNEDFQSNSVTLSTPSDNLVTNDSSQTLTWQPVIGATGYHAQIVNSANSVVVYEEDITGTSFSYTFPDGNFIWRVRATNGSQNTMYSSRLVLIDSTVPNTPVLVSPANLSNTSDNDVSFEWTRAAVAGTAEKDSIYIFSNQALTTLKYKNEETSPYSTSTLDDGTYWWYVRSFDAAGNVGPQSSVFSFTLN
jgi:hypothetical protein